MAYTSVTKVQGPFTQDNSQSLLYKIAWVLWGVANGDFGFLIRGTVTPVKGATITRTGFTGAGIASGSQTLLAANTARLAFTVDNRSGGDLFYRYGAAAATVTPGGYDVHVPANTSYRDTDYNGQVTFICSASSGAGVNVAEVAV